MQVWSKVDFGTGTVTFLDDTRKEDMTHSIISLGKAFPLDSLQRAVVSPVGSVGASKCLRPFEVATGDPHLCTLAPGKLSQMDSSSGFFSGPL